MASSKKRIYRRNGIVTETLPDTHFRVRLEDGREILAHLAGRLRLYRIKVLSGDKVTVEMSSPEDMRGRIVYRGR